MDAQHHGLEDARAGGSDSRSERHDVIGFALALWNGHAPVLTQHHVGLAIGERQHARDVKEYRVFRDATRTHAYMQCRYEYPLGEAPVDMDTVDGTSSWDVWVEYAEASRDDVLIEITLANRGRQHATLQVLPTIGCRAEGSSETGTRRALFRQCAANGVGRVIGVFHPALGERYLYAGHAATLLFIDDETVLTEYIVRGRGDVVNRERAGTKAVVHHTVTLGAGESATRQLRLTAVAPASPRRGSCG